jgi:hypothetical protein
MCALAAQFGLELKQFDFSQAFLQAGLFGKPVYVRQGPGQPLSTPLQFPVKTLGTCHAVEMVK